MIDSSIVGIKSAIAEHIINKQFEIYLTKDTALHSAMMGDKEVGDYIVRIRDHLRKLQTNALYGGDNADK